MQPMNVFLVAVARVRCLLYDYQDCNVEIQKKTAQLSYKQRIKRGLGLLDLASFPAGFSFSEEVTRKIGVEVFQQAKT